MMKRAPIFLGVSLVAVVVHGGVLPSVEQGRELFTTPRLGTNGKSCADCHPGGRGLEEAATFETGQLEKIVNQCISRPLAGKPVSPDSPEMKSLILYMRTFAPGSK